MGHSVCHLALPVEVPAWHHRSCRHLTLVDDRVLRLVFCEFDRGVEQRFVLDHTVDLHATRGRDHGLRLAIVDAHSEFTRRETSEHDGMHHTQPGTGEHRDGGLGDHRHVDDDPVALRYPAACQHAGETCDEVEQFAVGVLLDGAGDGAVVDQGGLVAAAAFDVAVEGVVTRVQLAADEPSGDRLGVAVDDLFPRCHPVDVSSGVGPELFGILEGCTVCRQIW